MSPAATLPAPHPLVWHASSPWTAVTSSLSWVSLCISPLNVLGGSTAVSLPSGGPRNCLQASRGRPGWVPQDSFPLSWQLLSPTPVLQEVWPPAISRGRREAEESVYHHAEWGPSAREGQRPALQYPHHRPVSGLGGLMHSLSLQGVVCPASLGLGPTADHWCRPWSGCWAGTTPLGVKTVASLIICIFCFVYCWENLEASLLNSV